MANTYIKLYTHIVFHIKTSSVKIRNNDLPNLYSYITGIANNIGCTIIKIGGTSDHVHMLITIPKDKTIIEIVRTIKGDSSKWIKTTDRFYRAFSWQEGYGAFSVSPTLIDKTKAYIQNQEEHHKKHSFDEEYKLFLKAYEVDFDERYISSD